MLIISWLPVLLLGSCSVIHLVVAKDNTCGVPGRFIGENVALLRDVADYASSSGTLVAILSLDQEKAFDRVDWSFMRSTLCAMGFGPSFIVVEDVVVEKEVVDEDSVEDDKDAVVEDEGGVPRDITCPKNLSYNVLGP